MDQAEGLCHRITYYFDRLNIERVYSITVIELVGKTGLWVALFWVGSLKSLFCYQCGRNIYFFENGSEIIF